MSPANWLSLKKAADMLGIHPTTLRRWADHGDVPVYVTPGGHRRFLESDIAAMIESQRLVQGSGAEQVWANSALFATQQRLQNQSSRARWLEVFDDAQRAEQRALGNRLLDLIMHHIALPESDESLLSEATGIANRYAVICSEIGLTAAQGLEIIIFFRDGMTEVALQMPQVADFDDDMRLRLMRKINQVFNLIQLTFVKYYSQQN